MISTAASIFPLTAWLNSVTNKLAEMMACPAVDAGWIQRDGNSASLRKVQWNLLDHVRRTRVMLQDSSIAPFPTAVCTHAPGDWLFQVITSLGFRRRLSGSGH